MIKSPPKSLFQKLKFLGPGFVLSASIVGSGELIATTTLGARAGFITFWVILVSCVIKVALQLEFGKHTIIYGRTAMEAFNHLPGKKLGKAHWSIWAFMSLMIFKISQLGGIIGGVALSLHIAIPGLPIWSLTLIAGFAASLLVFKGIYGIVEKFSLIMILLFTILTFASLYFLQFTDYAISFSDIKSGLTFSLPQSAVLIAIAAFGITGVGGDEIIHYTYWCSEKGYSNYVGRDPEDPEWETRAKGWIKVMELDAIAAMVVYTVVTAAFYLLGAAVLNGQGAIPQGYEMIETLSNMYTETLGNKAMYVFLLGAIIVLFSTLFSGLAAWTRQFTDIFGQVGWLNYENEKERKRSIAILAFLLPAVWAALFLFIKLPVLMVIFGGAVTSVILLLVIYAAIHFRWRMTPPDFKPGKVYDTALILSISVILFIAVYGVYKLI